MAVGANDPFFASRETGEKTKDIFDDTEVHPINGFLFWFAGVDSDAMKKCPKSQHTKYAAIGGAVLFTGILAFFSSSYAVYMIFENEFVAVLIGFCWALGIINLDKYLIVTTKKGENQIGNAIIRITMAIIIGFVVSRPLELRIFKTEIAEKLRSQLLEKQTAIRERFDGQIADRQRLLDKKQERVTEMTKIFMDEISGTGGTKKRGFGLIGEAKQEELKKEETRINQEKKPIQDQMSLLHKQREEALAELSEKQSYGILAQNNALSSIDDPGASAMVILVTLVLMMFEITPILLKITTKSGCYEKVVEANEKFTEECYDELIEVNKKLAGIRAQKKYESEKADLLKTKSIEIIESIVQFCKEQFVMQDKFNKSAEEHYKTSAGYQENIKQQTENNINNVVTQFFDFIKAMRQAITEVKDRYK